MFLDEIQINAKGTMVREADLLVMQANELLCPVPDPTNGSRLIIIEDGAIASFQGKIIARGTTEAVLAETKLISGAEVIDAKGQVIAPGFVDAHTHPIFFGTREHEFELRIQGKTYREIAEAGGGIRFSVRQLRSASREQLIEFALPYLDQFIQHGTTTIEAKSGYGLSLEDELKSLEVIQELNRRHPIDLIPTFLGAHEIPDEYRNRREAYIDLIIHEMLPQVADRKLAEFCDIFCEAHVFTVPETERILMAAQQLGLKPKLHADQLTASGGAQLAARLHAVSADHLDYITPDAIEQLRLAGTIPVLLPGAVFFLGLSHYAPARQMVAAGLSVALATDFNPGTCMTQSMPLMMTLGCIYLKLKPEEVWLASTLHAAQAVARQDQIGSLQPGAQADFVIWNIPNYRYLPYHFGVNLVHQVYKKGKLIWQNNSYQIERGRV